MQEFEPQVRYLPSRTELRARRRQATRSSEYREAETVTLAQRRRIVLSLPTREDPFSSTRRMMVARVGNADYPQSGFRVANDLETIH
jgi:hypothetical protein